MYFSLITPATGMARQAAHQWAGASGAYAEHQWLWRFFPGEAGSIRDFLFRRRDNDGIPRFYVVSQRPPTRISSAWHVEYRHYDPQSNAGEWLAFELRANPVVSHHRTGRQQRHDVIMEAKKRLLAARGLGQWQDWQADRCDHAGHPDPRPALYQLAQEHGGQWLMKRGADNGFALLPENLSVEGYQQHQGKQGQLKISTIDFKGVLQVTDPERFVSKALTRGIGHAKAFGCGLMLVRRI